VANGREEGTPQGGPLSPILSNLLLDELDRELEKRGHCFCRYADRHAAAKGHVHRLDEWIREKLRCYRLKQCKRAKAMADFLHQQGVTERSAWEVALSGKRWWRLAHTPQAHEAMNLQGWKIMGLRSLSDRYLELQSVGNRRMR
jgi:hypothetical protein